MANHKLPRFASVRGTEPPNHPVNFEGVVTSISPYGGMTYRGTGDTLVAAGLARPEWLPGTAACGAKQGFTAWVGDRTVAISRRGARHFEARYRPTRQEHEEEWERRFGIIGFDLADEATVVALERKHGIGPPIYRPDSPDVECCDPDSDWPPSVSHHKSITVGDGSKWHFRGPPEAMILAGILDPEETPGHPKCTRKNLTWGESGGRLFMATRLGRNVAVTLLGRNATQGRCVVSSYKPA